MNILHNISLQPYNTFGMNVPAASMVTLSDKDQLPEITALSERRKVLGGGSNILLTKPVDTLLLRNLLKGILVEREDKDHVWVRVQGGEVWHDFVLFAIGNNLGGVENLALIPGTVGAAPIQNIGAYGVEVKETIETVEAWSWEEQQLITLHNSDCSFGYRDSIFKQELKDKILITSVLFRLNKHPELRTSYGAINEELARMQAVPTVGNIAQAVINIRQSKLPDPKEIGNAGSFFKNPAISKIQYEQLRAAFPLMPAYPVDALHVKVPAGWLIEQTGLKGYRKGDAGVHARQALVLVNYGMATGEDIWNLSTEVISAVQSKFGIELEREVQVW
jgi:UDP-N-acetylmuramate dehydrogenase